VVYFASASAQSKKRAPKDAILLEMRFRQIAPAIWPLVATAVFALLQTPDFWKTKGIVAGIEELIGAEIQANSDEVAPPIVILYVDANHASWMSGHRGSCELAGVQ
jgi:hypothetical protein